MATFSPTEAVFEGFRVIRREPLTVVGWGAVSVAIGLVFFGLMMVMGFPQLMQQASQIEAGARTLPNIGAFVGFGLLSIPLGLLFYAVLICAVYRAVLRPSETGFARLRLGGDELRMALLLLILWVMYFALMIVLSIAFAIVGVVIGVGAASGGGDASGGAVAAVMGLVGLLYLVLAFSGAFYGTQFSMSGPMTFDKRELHVFRSWQVLKGNYWRVFGCYALNAFICFILYIVVLAVQAALSAAVGAPSAFTAMMNPAAAQNAMAMFTPAAIIVNLFSSFIGVAFYALWFAPGAAAYREITGKSTAAADVFA